MDGGKITDTILYWSANALQGLGTIAFINAMFVLEFVLSFTCRFNHLLGWCLHLHI
mgnify:CR=1 FL=1